jgi:hypothetical protein
MLRDRVTVVTRSGERFPNVRASVQKNKVIIGDVRLPIHEGDVIERALPNGSLEQHVILQIDYAHGAVAQFFTCHTRKEGAIPRANPTPSSVVYNLVGPGSRVNINSTDLSTNVVDVNSTDLFTELRKALESGLDRAEEREGVLAELRGLEFAVGQPSYVERYQKFIASVADHMSVVAPFIPALTQLLPS